MISIKSFKKSDIEARFKNSNIKYSAELEILKKPVIFGNLKFNRRLTIVIPGSPIVDERTRFTMAGDGFFGYNPAKKDYLQDHRTQKRFRYFCIRQILT